MSTAVRHYLEGVQFTPINNDEFTINFERDPSVKFSNDVTALNTVELPKEATDVLRQSIEQFGGQRALKYNIQVGGNSYLFMADLTSQLSFADVQTTINIERFRGKDDLVKSMIGLSFESLFQAGKIREYDFIDIPYVIMRPDAGEKAFQASIMMFFIGWQLAESIATTARLVGELISAVTPSVVIPVGATVNTGQIIKYALLIALEAVKIALLIVALIKLADQFFEYVHPKLRHFKAMTVDRLLTIALADLGLTYTSTHRPDFMKLTVLPIPMDYKETKWWQILESEDDRIINRGYPTSGDTVPTLMALIDELESIYNLRPVVRGNVLQLETKGFQNMVDQTMLPNNFNDQNLLDSRFSVDCTEWWKNKIISYTNDIADSTLYDNPRGLRVEYLAYADDDSEWTRIRGSQRIQINFALGTIKKETKLESIIKSTLTTIDNFLGTNYNSRYKKRDGVLAVSQPNFNVTKLLYQVGGKQTSDYVEQIGAGALWRKYHYMDVPSNLTYRVYSEVPMQFNNETFLGIINDNGTYLEGTEDTVDVISCAYTYEDSTAITTFRMKDLNFGRFVKVKKIYEE